MAATPTICWWVKQGCEARCGMSVVFLEIVDIYLLSLNLNTTGVHFILSCSKNMQHVANLTSLSVTVQTCCLSQSDTIYGWPFIHSRSRRKTICSMVIWTRKTRITHSHSRQAWHIVSAWLRKTNTGAFIRFHIMWWNTVISKAALHEIA